MKQGPDDGDVDDQEDEGEPDQPMAPSDRRIGHIRHSGTLVCLGVGLLALAGRAALLPWRPVPEPVVHDEFSYLLGADTFRMGRIVNPPHPMWEHFETFHELMQPAYASKYPPAQALVLAAGWKLFGHPWYGVWLSCGFLCGALCWMLQGWFPPRLALLGGLMAAAQWGIAGYWVNSYWGGAVAAAAGALVAGAVPRLARRPTAGIAVTGAFGVVLLAVSRPYEGALAVTGAVGALCIWRKRSLPWIPIASVIVASGVLFLYYNYRVTGNALCLPYALYQAQYGAAPLFWFLPCGSPPPYRHEVIRRLWTVWDMSYYRLARAFPPRVLQPFLSDLHYLLTPVSAPAALAAILRPGRKVRIALGMFAFSAAGLLMERFSHPHYLAPALGPLLVLVMAGVRRLPVRWFAVMFFAVSAFQATRLTEFEYPDPAFSAQRREVMARLEKQGGQHLVIVRYGLDHNLQREWVYNRADIDGSEIVWARDMGPARNRDLINYYSNRNLWILEADEATPRLRSASPTDSLSSAETAN